MWSPKKKGILRNSQQLAVQIEVFSKTKTKKRKSTLRPTFCVVHIFSGSSPNLTPIFFGGGLFSFLDQKSASKLLKIRYFAYFSGQCGAAASSTSPSSYATVQERKMPSIITNYYSANKWVISICVEYFKILKSNFWVYLMYITPKCVSMRGLSRHHCALATQLFSKKCRSGGEPLTATLCQIQPVRYSDPETNASSLDQLLGVREYWLWVSQRQSK